MQRLVLKKMRETGDVVIIGGGSIGCATAYYLAKKGVKNVVLLEKRYLASGSTGRCGAGIRSLMDRGYIRRFGATLRHQQSGYEANALVAWAVPEADLQRIGRHLAGQRAVTHCYARRPAPSWPYNLYTMIHGRTPDECVEIAAQMAAETGIHDYEVLFSETELKKTTMRYFKE